MKSDKVQSKLNRDAREVCSKGIFSRFLPDTEGLVHMQAKESLVVNSDAAKKVREANTNFIQDEQQKQQVLPHDGVTVHSVPINQYVNIRWS